MTWLIIYLLTAFPVGLLTFAYMENEYDVEESEQTTVEAVFTSACIGIGWPITVTAMIVTYFSLKIMKWFRND